MRWVGGALGASPLRHAPRAAHPRLVREDVDQTICANVDRTAFAFGTVERDDLPACVAVLMEGFYKE